MPFIVSPGGGTTNTLPVPFSIMWDSGISEANPETGPQATVRFKCLWNDHYSLVQGLLGLWTGTPPSNTVYVGPYEYPPSPNLFCTSVSSIVGLGKPLVIASNFLNQTVGLPWITKQRAIVTAHFTRPQWQPATSGGYFSIQFSGAGEFLTLPETTYRFGDGTPTNTPIGVLIPEAQITVTRYRMSFLPDYYMTLLCGQLNNTPFQIGNVTYAQGSLLFMPGNSSTESDVLGNLSYTAEYRFMFRPVDWNYYLHPNRTTGFAVVTDGNGNSPYQYANFNVLP